MAIGLGTSVLSPACPWTSAAAGGAARPSCSWGGAAGSSAAPLTLEPWPGLLHLPALLQGSHIPWEAEAQGPVQCGSSPTVSALVRHSPFLSSARTKAGAARGAGKSLPCSERSNCRSSLAVWRAQQAAEQRAHPEACPPLHVAISTSAGPGAVPRLAAALVPLSTAGLGARPWVLVSQGAPRFCPRLWF